MRRTASSRRLVTVIRARSADVLARWEATLRRDGPGRALPSPVLLDHLPDLLTAVAGALAGGPSVRWQALRHADERVPEGYRIEDVLAELAALRDAVLEVREEEGPLELGEAAALARVFDAAVTASVERLGDALREADRAREDASARLASLFESAPVGLAFWDRDLRFVRLNRQLAEVNGLPVEAHLGRTAAELFPGLEGIDRIERRCRDILAGGEPWIGAEISGETPAAPGVRRHWREDFFPVRRGRDVVGIGAVVVETTEAHRASARLELLARAGQELAEAATHDVVLARMTRLAVPDLADLCAAVRIQDRRIAGGVEVAAADPDVAAAWRALVEHADGAAGAVFGRALRDGRPEVIPRVRERHLEAAAPDAETRELLVRLGLRSFVALPLRAHGRVVGALALATARSRRVLDRRDLGFLVELGRRCAVALDSARLLDEARAEAELRDRVLAFVSHDLRNPLSTVLLGASRLAGLELEGPQGARVRAGAEQIRRAVSRMRRLIEDLLDAAAIEKGQLSVHPRPERARSLAGEAVDGIAPRAREKGVLLSLAPGPALPEIVADRDRVIQALGNLLSNAITVTEAGRRVVVSAARAGDSAVFTVADEGPGIADGEGARLFEPYRRGASAGYRGTGLGLAITRGIVEAHGGRIWVDSRPGEGARFSFTIPFARSAADAESAVTPGA